MEVITLARIFHNTSCFLIYDALIFHFMLFHIKMPVHHHFVLLIMDYRP